MAERRLAWLARIVIVWGAAIFLKLVSLEVVHHQEYARKARERQELVIDIPGPRGTIYDRTGKALAMSVPMESVYVNPKNIPDVDVAAGLLAFALDLDRNELRSRIAEERDNHRGFLWIKRLIDPGESQRLAGLPKEWIGIQKETQRHYPNGQLAAHVLGSVDFAEDGNAGIEKALDKVLRGTPGRLRILTDVKRRGIWSELESEAHPGSSLTLTIDPRVQFVAEQELADAVKAHGAASGSVVVMNPENGDILALASYPYYDPNLPPGRNENIARQNHAVSVPFEPGSIFKVVTLSAALETTKLTPDSPINCHGGVLPLPGRVVHDSHLGLGIIPMAMVLAKSSNVGAIEVGMQVGQANMYEYVRKFGFGQRTGVTLPAESGGKLRRLNRWGKTSLASISIGQEISVTTIQLARAASVIANGGKLVRPRLVMRIDGVAVPVEPGVPTLKPDTVMTMRQLMEGVVLRGTGGGAKLAGYSVGGKTGSAQIFDFIAKRYSHNTYNGSFVGFAPLNNPAIVVVVSLNGTHGTAGFGGAAAAPVFKKVASEALRVLDVPKDIPDEPMLVAKAGDVADLADAGSDGEPNILEDPEEDAEPAPQAATNVAVAAAGPKVPDFRGMTMRAVLAEAASKGLAIMADGSGVARRQTPAAGAVLRQGERIFVRFSR